MDVYLNSTCSVCPKQIHNVSKDFKQWYSNDNAQQHHKSLCVLVVNEGGSCPRLDFYRGRDARD